MTYYLIFFDGNYKWPQRVDGPYTHRQALMHRWDYEKDSMSNWNRIIIVKEQPDA